MWRFNAFCLSLPLTSARLSDIKTKSVIETFLFSQILAKFEKGQRRWQQRSRYGYILSRKGELYTSRAWVAVAYLSHGNARSLTER